MNLSTNDFANRELSVEELEAIAAGNWLGDAVRFVGHELEKGVNALAGGLASVAGTVAGVAGRLHIGPVHFLF
jgi:hypothetical protein